MSKAILNGEVIDTRTYRLEETPPPRKFKIWWVIYACMVLAILTIGYYKMPQWLGLPQPDSRKSLALDVVFDSPDATKVIGDIDSLSEKYPYFDADFVEFETTKRKFAFSALDHISDRASDIKTSLIDHRGTITYELYVSKEELAEYLAQYYNTVESGEEETEQSPCLTNSPCIRTMNG